MGGVSEGLMTNTLPTLVPDDIDEVPSGDGSTERTGTSQLSRLASIIGGRLGRALVGCGILALLLASVGWAEVAGSFTWSLIPWAGVLICLLPTLVVIAGFNVWLLLRRLEPVPLATFIRVYLMTWSATLFAPGQLGDGVQVWILKRYQVSPEASAAAYLIDKFLSLLFIGCIALVGGLFYLPIPVVVNPVTLAILLVAIVGSVGLAVLVLKRQRSRTILRVNRFFKKCVLQMQLAGRSRLAVVLNVTITAAKWCVTALCYWLAFRAFDVPVSWDTAVVFPAMTTLVAYIPVSLGGIGTVEASATALYSTVGVAPAKVAAVHVFLRVLQLVNAAILLMICRTIGKGADLK